MAGSSFALSQLNFASVIYYGFLAVAASGILYALWFLRHFVIRRKHQAPESYPFQNTIRMVQSMGRILDELQVIFKEVEEKAEGRKTVVITAFGIAPLVVTTDVKNVTYILKTNFENFGKAGPEFKPYMQGLLGNGIFNADGQTWYAHRKTSAHLFKLSKFKTSVLNVFNEDLDQLITWIRSNNMKNKAFDFHNIIHRYTMESIAKIAFGISLNCIFNENVNFMNDFDYCTFSINESLMNPLWMLKRYLSPAGWKYYYCLYRLNNFAYKLIKERRDMVKKNLHKNMNDLLSLYLDKDSFTDGEELNGVDSAYIEPNDSTLRDVILNMIIAGRDTTAQALSWSFYHLCLHPEEQTKVRNEINTVLSNHKSQEHDNKSIKETLLSNNGNGFLTYECINDLKYLEAFCMEVLRLHPSVPKEAKCCFKADTLPDGTPVYPGDIVSFVPWCMGRDKDLWGENAEQFIPDRFLNQPKPSPFIFTAFQAGPRTCLGQNFAMLEMKCVIARLLLLFEFSFGQDPSIITYENSLTLPMKGGMKLIAKEIYN